MNVNLGNPDRIIRLIAGLILTLAPLLNIPAIWSNGTFAYISIAIGLILIGTSLFRFCPIYRVFGISTCKL